jgi:parvulin-like peptidyl-prolyl isomerase
MRPHLLRRACLAILLAAGAAALCVPARAEVVEEIVAKVNNSIITRSQFEERLALYQEQLSRKYSGSELAAKVDAAADELLHNMIIETLLVQRGDVLLDMDKVRKNLLDDFKKQQKIETDDELDRLLKEQNMSRQDLLETLVRLSIPQEIISYEVRRKISVSDKDMKAYYDEHHQEFVRPERVLFREIVILFEEANKAEARARAEAVRRELDAGGDFGEVASKESEVSSKERGGLVGPFGRGELRSEIEKVVFSLKPGELAGPIESSRAFHVVRLETKQPEEVTPLADAKEAITEKVRDTRFKENLETYLEGLWKENYIYVFPRYGDSQFRPTEDPVPGPEQDSKP